jgi:hypothetical protein
LAAPAPVALGPEIVVAPGEAMCATKVSRVDLVTVHSLLREAGHLQRPGTSRRSVLRVGCIVPLARILTITDYLCVGRSEKVGAHTHIVVHLRKTHGRLVSRLRHVYLGQIAYLLISPS